MTASAPQYVHRRSRTLRWRLVLLMTAALVVAVGVSALFQARATRNVVLQRTRDDAARLSNLMARASLISQRAPEVVDEAIGEQMVGQARLAAQLVAIGKGAGMTDAEIADVFAQVAAQSEAKEFWITDPSGKAVIHNLPVEFTFSPDPNQQPQAYVFYNLLGEPPAGEPVIQDARKREIDAEVWKYTGVPGVDQSRIVQVGVPAPVIERLRQEVDTQRFVDSVTDATRDVESVLIVDDAGQPIASGTIPGADVPEQSQVDELGAQARASGKTATKRTGDTLLAATPVVENGRDLGVVFVELSLADADAAARNVVRQGLLIGLAALAAGLILAYFGGRRIVRPVEAITSAAVDLSEQRFDPTSLDEVADRNDELGELARTFRSMGTEIVERERRLREQVESLKVEIDRTRVDQEVGEIVESDFFKDLQSRASEMRRKVRGDEPSA